MRAAPASKPGITLIAKLADVPIQTVLIHCESPSGNLPQGSCVLRSYSLRSARVPY